MGRSLDPKKIKSAQRALEVLQYFNASRPRATVMDIARSMGYPQSSTSELLSYLVALGYLHRDRHARTYRPSARVALLGAWVQPAIFRSGHLLPMLDELAEQTQATVALSMRVGMSAQCIHVVRPAAALGASDRSALQEGITAPLTHASTGKVLLSTVDPDLVRKLVHRHNAEHEAEARVSYATLAAELNTIAARGYAIAPAGAGTATISMLLPRTSADEPLALGLCGPAAWIEQNADRLIGQMRGAVARHFGPPTTAATAAPRPAAQPEYALRAS